MAERSRRPYLIRAIYEWAADCGHTPHLVVAADGPGVQVPRDYVAEGRITLNIAMAAVQGLDLRADPIRFSARFGGRPFQVIVPSGQVLAIFAKETGEGIVFGEPETGNAPPPPEPEPPEPPKPRGHLRVVK